MVFNIIAAFLFAVCGFQLNVHALEISLEENRGERGVIGYVDIEQVFKDYPETLKAKEDFQAKIQGKERTLNEKKSEIFKLKAEINKLKQEREFAARLPVKMDVPEETPPVFAAESSTGPLNGVQFLSEIQPPKESTSAVSVEISSSVPGFTAEQPQAGQLKQDAGSPPQNISSQIPASTAVVSVEISSSVPSPSLIQESTASSAGEAPKTDSQSILNLPGLKRKSGDAPPPAVSASVAEMDSAIKEKETQLIDKETMLRGLQRQVERELLDYESRKTEIILGKIYQTLRELAVNEGVSIIVEKRTILYGQPAVDLTDKLMKKIRGF